LSGKRNVLLQFAESTERLRVLVEPVYHIHGSLALKFSPSDRLATALDKCHSSPVSPPFLLSELVELSLIDFIASETVSG
jgi:hypothetical protein